MIADDILTPAYIAALRKHRPNLPLEIVEYRAVKAAAEDIAKSYGVDARKAFRRIARILARRS